MLAAVLAAACTGGFAATWWLLVTRPTGQLMERVALDGSRIGAHFVSDHARNLLHVVSLPAAVGLVLVVLIGALWRGSRRRALWAAGAVVAINISAQLLKYLILSRPDYGLSEKASGANTLPSGHTAVAASAAVALILVVGPRWRGPAAWAGALLTAAMGYSTLVCQWHRPADVVAAILLAVAWGAVAVACGAWGDELPEPSAPGRVPAAAVLGGLGILAAAAALALEVLTWRAMIAIDAGSVLGAAQAATRSVAFVAYAAGAVGTVAMSATAMAALALLTPRDTVAGRRDEHAG
ncbi:phosphatase PAP2 family protein [Actinomyces sp. MRS3W]|uniref:phosphatase PAP2 family protein n=1 Tax=Actinomyces sp. MRS3W TaxID=2800796 RepID=UPI0028FD3FE2|nr:phosphatase PAP2 family protein [Actinomyces sp. MRS3W]MDU0348888.1 phosphatase PAP2 family protein [Actinomyces sp. MRS3W]